MALAEVASQRASATPVDGGTTCAKAFPNNVTSGNLLIAGGAWFSPGTSAISSLTITSTRTTGNWTITGFENGTSDSWVWIAYAAATSSGACTVTATGQGSSDFHAYAIDEWSGQNATPLSVSSSETEGNDAVPTVTGGLTTLTSGELILAVMSHIESAATNLTVGTGFVQIGEEEDGVNHDPYNFQFQLATTATNYPVGWTIGGASRWNVMAISIKEATGGGPVTVGVSGSAVTPGSGTAPPGISIGL